VTSTGKYSEADSPEVALHWAIEQLDLPAVELMLMNGVNANARSKGGFTALQRAVDIEADAAIQNDWAVVPVGITALLLAFDADPLLTDDRGRTALDTAAGRHRQAIALMKRHLGEPSEFALAPNGAPRDPSGVPTWLWSKPTPDTIGRCTGCDGNFDVTDLTDTPRGTLCGQCQRTDSAGFR